MLRNCRQDVPAGKSIGRVSKVAFSHIHFLFPEGLTDPKHPCSWLWPPEAVAAQTPPASCTMVGNYPSTVAKRGPPFTNYGIFNHNLGVNHGESPRTAVRKTQRAIQTCARAWVNCKYDPVDPCQRLRNHGAESQSMRCH